ncbi:hypothetical protein [Persicobacter psychrovividus]|uniref:Uncharacterized protein n=1 Tax=Persicobacter psychrovividus TaxID=387638 RepID=A0ABM7VNB7_9BACT|nr:hypothetical protein PEPS_47760 [Persicobacter psychrovividus]
MNTILEKTIKTLAVMNLDYVDKLIKPQIFSSLIFDQPLISKDNSLNATKIFQILTAENWEININISSEIRREIEYHIIKLPEYQRYMIRIYSAQFLCNDKIDFTNKSDIEAIEMTSAEEFMLVINHQISELDKQFVDHLYDELLNISDNFNFEKMTFKEVYESLNKYNYKKSTSNYDV